MEFVIVHNFYALWHVLVVVSYEDDIFHIKSEVFTAPKPMKYIQTISREDNKVKSARKDDHKACLWIFFRTDQARRSVAHVQKFRLWQKKKTRQKFAQYPADLEPQSFYTQSQRFIPRPQASLYALWHWDFHAQYKLVYSMHLLRVSWTSTHDLLRNSL
jgi:hypothetical protein